MKPDCRIWGVLFFAVYLLLAQAAVSYALDIVSSRDLTISIPGRNMCSEPVDVFIRTDRLSYFTGDKAELQKAIALSRAALSSCPDLERINIFGAVNKKIAYRGHVAKENGWQLTDDFFKDVTATAPWPQTDSRSWTTHLIGTWKGYKFNTEMEIALWLPQTASGPTPFLHALVRTTDGMCCFESGDSMMGNWDGYLLPEETKDYEALHLQYSIVPYILAVNDNFRPTNKEKRLCDEDYRSFNFVVLVDRKTGQVFMYNGKSSLYLHPQASLWPLARVDASEQMMALIDYIQRRKGKGPTPAQKILIADKSQKFENHADRIPVSCMVDYQFALAKLRMAGMDIVEAFPVDGASMVEVTSRDLSGKKDSNFYAKNPDVDWENLSLGKSFKFTAEGACRHAEAALAFLSYARGQEIETGPGQQKTPPKLEKLNNYYLVDKHGVDILTMFDPSPTGRAERAFGSTTVFQPGDKTRDVRWNGLSQKLIIKNYIKSIIDKEISPDIFNDLDERKFVYDSSLSSRYKAPVFSSAESEYMEDGCYEWRGRLHVDTCYRYMQKGTRKPRIYITNSKDIASAIFKSLSPDEKTWIGIADEKDTCPGGPFCELEAGEYINAIYRADYGDLRAIEDKALVAFNKTARFLASDNEKMIEFFSAISGRPDKTFLPLVLNEYMYGYHTRPQECFKEGKLIAEYRSKDADMVFKTVYPMLGYETEDLRIEGRERYAEYHIKPEFKDACDELGNSFGSNKFAPVIDALLNEGDGYIRKVYSSMDVIGQRYDCNSPEVKQFEKNMLELYFYNNAQLGAQSIVRNTY